VALFKKKPKEFPPVTCPVCSTTVTGLDEQESHWLSHVSRIPDGQGDASGQYSWTCGCGHCRMKWPGNMTAALALKYHLHRAHSVPLSIMDYELLAWDREPSARHLRSRLS
jgi:hypothetical protein